MNCAEGALIFDFDGVFTNNDVFTLADGSEIVRSSRGDGMLFKSVLPLFKTSFVVSGECSFAAKKRVEKLGLRYWYCHGSKALFVTKLAALLDFELANSVFLGNDLNDRDLLEIVGFPFVVSDHTLKSHLDVGLGAEVLGMPGGGGAVRELTEKILVNIC